MNAHSSVMSNTGVGRAHHLGALHHAGDLQLVLDVGGRPPASPTTASAGDRTPSKLTAGVAPDQVDAPQRRDRHPGVGAARGTGSSPASVRAVTRSWSAWPPASTGVFTP